MSLVTLFTRSAPTFAGIEFDAVLEDTLEVEIQNTGFTIESGARAADHRIIQPIRWSLTVVASNNPIEVNATDFVGGALSNLTDNALLSTVAGLSAGLLAGSQETRASNVLNALIAIAVTSEPFDIDAGDIQLSNMVINRIRRTKNPDNETGLVAVCDLQELPTLSTVISGLAQPSQSQLRDGDPSKSQAASAIERGEQAIASVGDSINNSVDSVLGSIF